MPVLIFGHIDPCLPDFLDGVCDSESFPEIFGDLGESQAFQIALKILRNFDPEPLEIFYIDFTPHTHRVDQRAVEIENYCFVIQYIRNFSVQNKILSIIVSCPERAYFL